MNKIDVYEHCFFDYFPVVFRFEDLCLCSVHAKKLMNTLSSKQWKEDYIKCENSIKNKNQSGIYSDNFNDEGDK